MLITVSVDSQERRAYSTNGRNVRINGAFKRPFACHTPTTTAPHAHYHAIGKLPTSRHILKRINLTCFLDTERICNRPSACAARCTAHPQHIFIPWWSVVSKENSQVHRLHRTNFSSRRQIDYKALLSVLQCLEHAAPPHLL